MWPGLSSAPLLFLCALLTGVAVKLMDDVIDESTLTAATLTPAGAAVYALAALAAGVAINPHAGVSLFAAAYATGMLTSPGRIQPSGLPAWLESALAFTIAALIAGLAPAAQSLLAIVAIQLVDDLIDFRADATAPDRNWARRFGRVEAALAAAIGLTLATWFGIALPAAALAASACIWFGETWCRRRGSRCRS